MTSVLVAMELRLRLQVCWNVASALQKWPQLLQIFEDDPCVAQCSPDWKPRRHRHPCGDCQHRRRCCNQWQFWLARPPGPRFCFGRHFRRLHHEGLQNFFYFVTKADTILKTSKTSLTNSSRRVTKIKEKVCQHLKPGAPLSLPFSPTSSPPFEAPVWDGLSLLFLNFFAERRTSSEIRLLIGFLTGVSTDLKK